MQEVNDRHSRAGARDSEFRHVLVDPSQEYLFLSERHSAANAKTRASMVGQTKAAPTGAAFVFLRWAERLRRLVHDVPEGVLVRSADFAELVARGLGLFVDLGEDGVAGREKGAWHLKRQRTI